MSKHTPLSNQNFFIFLGASLAVIFIWSAIKPNDLTTWLMEALPVVIGLALLSVTYQRFVFTRLAYGLMWLHAVILLIGAHYTYSEVPAFNWLRDSYDLSRNHYDRLGHLAQGFFPAIVAREILLRLSPLGTGKWLFFIVACVCLAFSAFYEMLEWWAALSSETGALAFLGTQGDPWDTQWDMFLALLGALSAQLLLGPWHDSALAQLTARKKIVSRRPAKKHRR